MHNNCILRIRRRDIISRVKPAFTLAEVLITLGIIGIVATMTIPSLVQKIQDYQYIGKLKKNFSALAQAQEKLVEANGTFTSAMATCSTNNCFKNLFAKNFSYSLDCPTSPAGVCFPANSAMKYLNGTSIGGNNWGTTAWADAGFITNDGTGIVFKLVSNQCQSGAFPPYIDNCGFIVMDVNNINPPNTWGKDIYVFFVFANTIKPGAFYDDNTIKDSCGTGTNKGYSCASKYLYTY